MSEDMRHGLAGHGLTRARAQLLWELGRAERLTQKQLAQALEVTPRNVTALIDALESAGFVARTEHPTDRRSIVVVLTAKGASTVARLRSEMVAFADRLFGKLDENDLRGLSAILVEIGTQLAALAARRAEETRSPSAERGSAADAIRTHTPEDMNL